MQIPKSPPRTISSNEAKEQLNAIIDDIARGGEDIILESSANRAVIISYEEFLEVQEQRKRKAREDAYARLMKSLEGQAERNADLSDDDIEKLANRASREIREKLNREYRAGALAFPDDKPE